MDTCMNVCMYVCMDVCMTIYKLSIQSMHLLLLPDDVEAVREALLDSQLVP